MASTENLELGGVSIKAAPTYAANDSVPKKWRVTSYVLMAICAVLLVAFVVVLALYVQEQSSASQKDPTVVQKVSNATQVNPGLDEIWEQFKEIYNKTYNESKEEIKRRVIWEENVKYIQHHNREYDLGLHNYSVGTNEYSDMTPEEIVQTMQGYIMPNETNENDEKYVPPMNASLQEVIDWRQYGYVTRVKNQRQCGSCWAFSATGALEGQHFKTTRNLVSLSEQNLVDCVNNALGCKGGWPSQAFDYVKDNNGIDTESSYPYVGKDTRCSFTRANVGATCKGYKWIGRGSESDLQCAVAGIGPISVAIDARGRAFQSYKGGIYDNPSCSSTDLDHAVLVVGYGDRPRPYWLVKNSWGKTWGERGYIKMSRGKNNQCGIATNALYPLV